MSTPMSLIASGTFVSNGKPRTIELPKAPNYFILRNRSRWGTSPGSGTPLIIESFWYTGFSDLECKNLYEDNAAAVTAGSTTTAGFKLVDLSNQTVGAPVAITAITAATAAVASTATTPAETDIVRVYGTTGMLQIGGMDFTVGTVVDGVSFELAYMAAAGFAAAATAGTYRVIPRQYYQPTNYYITGISQAASAVITVSVAHNYLVGDKIRVAVPTAFGMTEINGLLATVTAVGTSTITVDVDSTGFTAFAFPTSAVAGAGVTFPHVTPVGEVSSKLTSAMDNTGYYGMYCGLNTVGANSQTMDWLAFSRDYTF